VAPLALSRSLDPRGVVVPLLEALLQASIGVLLLLRGTVTGMLLLLHLLVPQTRRLQMLVQIGLEGEGLVAPRALVVFVGRVGLHVRPQIRAVGERLAAVGASVRLLAGVAAQMTLQQPGSREHLAAYATTVGELVREHVHRQGGHADVSLAAVDALLGRLRVETAMRLLVPRQVRRRGVLLAALGARELGPVRLGRLLVGHGGAVVVAAAATATFRSAIGHEEGLVGVGDSLAAGAVGQTLL